MTDVVMIMMGEGPDAVSDDAWETYIDGLVEAGKLRGGSSLGNGIAATRDKDDGISRITGYIRLSVTDLDEAKSLLKGNPLYEAGGSVHLLEEIPD